MTEDQALEYFRQIEKEARADPEIFHSLADDLMLDVLSANGFDRLAERLKAARHAWWYA